MPQPQSRPEVDADQLVRTALVLLFALVVVRDAWVGDDAYITLRTVDNWVTGRGLVWNLGERVQAYTHPLWMLVLASLYAFTREGWWTLVVPSVACSVAAAVVVSKRLVPSGPTGWAVLALLPLSRAYVDYSTSGLENPLTHLLIAAVLAVWFGREPGLRTVTVLGALLGLVVLNRMDALLLVGPMVAVATWDARNAGVAPRALFGRLLLGMLPFLAWEAFALFYYGSLVPNTALAKLDTGIPRSELEAQGLLYLLDALERDPLTVLVLAGGLVVPTVLRDRRGTVAALGGVLYVLYVVRIGGDFMTGRFLAAPFLVAVACLGRVSVQPPAAGALAALAVVVSFGARSPTLAPIPVDPSVAPAKADARGIADERAFYAWDGNGLASAARTRRLPGHRWRDVGEHLPKSHIVLVQAAGMRGWAGAPSNHFVDELGLSDPFLARLPAVNDPAWRVGHYRRAIPAGYLDTLLTGDDAFEDPALAALYHAVRVVTHDPIWSTARFKEIWRLNTGYYRIDTDRYRFGEAVPLAVGAPQDAMDSSLERSDLVEMEGSGAVVDLDGPATLKWLLVRRRADDDLRVLFYREGVRLAEVDLPREIPSGEWLSADYVEVPKRVVETGYDVVRVVPVDGPRPWLILSVELAPKRTRVEGDGSEGEALRPVLGPKHGGAKQEGVLRSTEEPGPADEAEAEDVDSGDTGDSSVP